MYHNPNNPYCYSGCPDKHLGPKHIEKLKKDFPETWERYN